MTDTPLDAIIDALEPPDGHLVDVEMNLMSHETPVPEEIWHITGTETAEWAARRWTRAHQAAEELEHVYNLEIAALTARRDQLKQRHDREQRFFAGKLEHYHRTLIAENPRAKTVHLLGATLTSRAGTIQSNVTDETDLVDWLQANAPEHVVIADPKPTLATIKKAYEAKIADEPGDYPAVDPATGEIVPGVTFTRTDRTYDIKPAE